MRSMLISLEEGDKGIRPSFSKKLIRHCQLHRYQITKIHSTG